MLVNLVPEFLDATHAANPLEAYRHYLERHSAVLSAYWHNYIIDLDSSHAEEVMRRTVRANRRDLLALIDNVDLNAVAEETIRRCEDVFEIDQPFDVYVTVGVGGANAGELVIDGRGVAFICVEHFTGRPNDETLGLGLPPDLIAPWIAHEIAHTVRYTSPESESEIATIVRDLDGYYDYWETGSRATLRELLVNEGLAVTASQLAVPGFEPWDYLGYARRQYRRLRQLESFLTREIEDELDHRGLGYRLRYLSGGVAANQRLVGGKVIPERAGYYLGQRMVEGLVGRDGIGKALRASALDFVDVEGYSSGIQTA